MFEFITKKYEDEIKKLKWQIENMTYEWNKEKELYGKKTKKRFYKQKVDWTIGGIDMRKSREVHRPMYGLTEEDAQIIAQMVKENLAEQDIHSETGFHWRESERCYVIDVKTMN